jgi:hypothetical protein
MARRWRISFSRRTDSFLLSVIGFFLKVRGWVSDSVVFPLTPFTGPAVLWRRK